MAKGDDLDAFVARRTAVNPDFPQMVEAELETRRLVRALAAERERQGLSQASVAVALRTRQPNVARLERGAVDPRHTTLVRYARLLGKRIGLESINAEPPPPPKPSPTRPASSPRKTSASRPK